MPKRIFLLLGTICLSLTALWGLAALLFPAVHADGPQGCIEITADIAADTTWDAPCYRVMTSTVTVLPNIILTISPAVTGTRVEFVDNAQLQVMGTLRALGSPAHPITFTSANPGSGEWVGIILEDDSGGDRIQYSTVEYARTGVKINDEDDVQVLSSTFRYNGGSGSHEGAIGGDTDYSRIAGNIVYSCTNGIVLNESFDNEITGNTIYDIERYGVAFVEDPTVGGSNNLVADNTIYNCTAGAVRLENGAFNDLLGNRVYLNPGGALYLSDQVGSSVQANHVYSNGGGLDYAAALYVAGTSAIDTVAQNVIYEETTGAEAVWFEEGSAMWPGSLMAVNALCSIDSYELQNDGSTIEAPHDWWSSNDPASNILGPVNYTPWISLSITGDARGVITVTLRDADGLTVPPPPDPQAPPAPNARRVRLSTNWGSVSPALLEVNDAGIGTATLIPGGGTAPPTIILTATGFCGYATSGVVQLPNLALTKTTAVSQVVAGGTIAYQIHYLNDSAVAASDVHITDTLPAGTTWAGDTAPAAGWTRLSTAPPIWQRATLGPGVNGSFTLSVTVAPTAPCGAELVNWAAIGTDLLETSLADNSDSAGPVTVIGPDVTIAKTTPLLEVAAGGLLTYTIAYSNPGQAGAADVFVGDDLPAWTSYVADDSGLPCPACIPGGTGPLEWDAGSLNAGEGHSFKLVLRVDGDPAACGAALTNAVAISTSTPECDVLPNSAAATPVTVIGADVTIAKTTALTEVVAGGLLTYTITYSNVGPVDAAGVVITDLPPTCTTYVTSSPPCASCPPTGPLTWDIGPLAVGQRQSIELVLRADEDPACYGQGLVNTAIISTTTVECGTAPNIAYSELTTLVRGGVDLVVVKDDDIGPISLGGPARRTALERLLAPVPTAHRDFVYEGDIVTYTIAVVNVGTVTATRVVLTETLPQHTDYLGVGWNLVAGRTYTQAVGTLAPDEGRIFYFVVQVHDPMTECVTNLVNQVCGFGAEEDLDPEDNCNYEDTPVRCYPLRVSKIAEPCVSPGETFRYTITYQNRTTDTTFFDVTLTDTLDVEVSYAGAGAWDCNGRICTRTVLTIPPGVSDTLHLQARLSASFPYTIRTTFSNVIEIEGGNRFVLFSPIDTGPDLAVVKNDNVGPVPPPLGSLWDQLSRRLGLPEQAAPQREFVRPGDPITYTILYLNQGISPTTDVVLIERLPDYTRYVGGGWTAIGGRHYQLDVGDLAPGAGGVAEFIVQVDDPFPPGVDRVVNRVDIAGAVPECDMRNNWSADDTPVRTGVNLYVANLESHTVDVFDAATFAYSLSIPIENPFGMAASAAHLFVANFEDGSYTSTLTAVDLGDHAVAGMPGVGRHPIHVAHYDGLVYVANHSGGEGITVVDAQPPFPVVARLRPDRRQTYDFGFFGVAVDATRGRIYATKRDFGSQGIWMITPSGGTFQFDYVVDTGEEKPSSIVYNPILDRVYVTFGLVDELWVFDPDTWELLQVIPTGHQDPVDPGYGGHGLATIGRCVFVSNYMEESITAVIEGSCTEDGSAVGPPSPPAGPYRVYLPIANRDWMGRQVVLTVPLTSRPKGLAAAGNLLLVTLPFEDQIAIVDLLTLQVSTREIAVLGDHPHTVTFAGGR
ncbi:MAG: DUF11 domain-containing protein [Anaerolineae bacterium]|nr:DUF11 domain-containing protein [Anaerolineae bacterium]